MDNIYLLATLRLLHIFCGVFWAGTAMYLAAYVLPAANALGPDGGKFMQQVGKTNKFPLIMSLAGTLTILTGAFLMYIAADQIGSKALFSSGYGMVMSIGATFGVVAMLVGFFVNRPAVERMNAISQEIAKAGGPPSPAQMQEIGTIRAKLGKATTAIAFLVGSTVICMALMDVFRR